MEAIKINTSNKTSQVAVTSLRRHMEKELQEHIKSNSICKAKHVLA